MSCIYSYIIIFLCASYLNFVVFCFVADWSPDKLSIGVVVWWSGRVQGFSMSNASLSRFGVFVSVIVVSVNPCRHALGPSFLHPTPLIAALQKHRKAQMHVDRPHIEQDISGVTAPAERMTLIWARYWTACGERSLCLSSVMADGPNYVPGIFQTSTQSYCSPVPPGQQNEMGWIIPLSHRHSAEYKTVLGQKNVLCTCWSQIRNWRKTKLDHSHHYQPSYSDWKHSVDRNHITVVVKLHTGSRHFIYLFHMK